MADTDLPANINAGFERHATALGATATLSGVISSPFMSGDYRIIGIAFTAISIILTGVVACHKWLAISVKMKWAVVVVQVMVMAGSLGMLCFFYMHPPAPIIQAAPAPAAAITHESHDTYTSTTTGKNSPVINGTTAPIQIGDNPDPPPAKKSGKQR